MAFKNRVKHTFIRMNKLLMAISIFLSLNANAQSHISLSLSMVIDTLTLDAPAAQIQRLSYENDLLQFENYKKGFLPSVSISLSPISFNRSIVMLQQATDGQYNYVEDYSNSSSTSISVSQKVLFTGGTLSANSSLNYMNELSQSRHSFSASPFSISYSQQLFGSGKTMRMEKTIEYKKNEENIKEYCKGLSGIQQKAVSLFMDTFLASLAKTQSSSNRLATDSLFRMAKVRYENKRITESDYKQIELQAINNEYMEENAAKNFEDALRILMTFLNLSENHANIEIEKPAFTLPVQINPENVRFYIRENNPAMLNREIRRLEAERQLYTSELQNKFNANINLSYGMNQYAQNLADVYSNPSRRQGVSISFSIPFSMWGINRNTARIAQNNYRSSIISLENEIDEFENEIDRMVNNYNHSVNLWFIAERSYLLAQEQFKLTVQEFAIGRSSTYELIASQMEQASAMQKYYSAVRDVYEIYYRLRDMTLYDFENKVELTKLFLNY